MQPKPGPPALTMFNRKANKKSLQRPRSRLSQLLISSASLIFFLVSIISGRSVSGLPFTDIILVNFGVTSFILICSEFGNRFLHLFEELRHLRTRYEGSVMTAFQDVFALNPALIVTSVASGFALMFEYLQSGNPGGLMCSFGCTSMFCSVIGGLLLNRVLELARGPLYDSLWIENSHGLDYGSGMAHSFFHGYLKLVLPRVGNEDKNIEELMQDYESKQGITLACYKLFILIPKSLYCPVSLMDREISSSSISIEDSRSLEEKKLTVAGVKDRSYKNSVYKIKVADSDKPIYVAAEYASPLKTFRDVIMSNGEHAYYYKKYKNEIVLQFYLTLQKVLNEHVNCTNLCELIFYDDKDEKGRFYDVAEILLGRIKSSTKRDKSKQL